MISLALVADAIIGNVQEKTIKQYNASNSEVDQEEKHEKKSLISDIFAGCALQLQYWVCLPFLSGGSIYRHSISH